MSTPLVIPFGACEVWVWADSLYVETRFADSTRAPATRDCEVYNRAYARASGL